MSIVSLKPRVVGLTSGSSDKLTLGTGHARPGGVESVFEYNGALLNVRDWYDTFIITSIDGLGDADVRDSRDVNPGRHGETYFNAYYGGRTIVISGKIRAFSLSKLRDMQQGLKQIFGNLSQESPLYIRTGDINRDVFIYCKKSAPIAMAEAQTNFEYTREFQITLRASNPRFLSYLEERIAYTSGWSELSQPITGVIQATNILANATPQNTGSSATPANGGAVVQGWRNQSTGIAPILQSVVPSASLGFASPRVIRTGGTTLSSNPGFPYLGATYGAQASGPFTTATIVPVVPSKFYTIKGKSAIVAKPGLGVRYLRVITRYYNDAGSNVSAYIHDFSLPKTGTPAFDFIFTEFAPATATSMRFEFIYSGTSVDPSTYWEFLIGDLMLVPNTFWNGDWFNGDSMYSLWTGAAYASSSVTYKATTGLELKYANENFVNATWYVDADGWIKPTGPKTSPIRQIYRSDQVTDFTDIQVTLKYHSGASVLQSVLAGDFGHVVKRLSGSDFIYCKLVPDGASSRVEIWLYSGISAPAMLAQSSTFTMTANTDYWLRAILNGNQITVQQFVGDPVSASPVAFATSTLAGANATKYGDDVVGGFGVRQTLAGQLDWWWRNHDIDPVSSSSIVAFTASNGGSAPAQPVFNIYGPVSAATAGGNAIRIGITEAHPDGTFLSQNFILNAKSGSTLAISSGNYIQVDTDKRTLKEFDSLGDFVRNSYDQLDFSSDWIELEPGANLVEIEMYAPGATPTLEMRYRHSYW
jgi:hypothetical protein